MIKINPDILVFYKDLEKNNNHTCDLSWSDFIFILKKVRI